MWRGGARYSSGGSNFAKVDLTIAGVDHQRGVSIGVFTLSRRADRPRAPLPEVDMDPLPNSATGELAEPKALD